MVEINDQGSRQGGVVLAGADGEKCLLGSSELEISLHRQHCDLPSPLAPMGISDGALRFTWCMRCSEKRSEIAVLASTARTLLPRSSSGGL